jgi:phage shock protein A
MEAKVVSDIALRLLKLEQRFESYCTLHEEELREIKATLGQLRKDILSLHRDLETGPDKDDLVAVPDDDVSREGAPDSSSVLTL